MVRKTYSFDEWLPDLADNGAHLTIADGVYPIADGFAPVGSPVENTDAIPAAYKGGAAYVGSSGTAALLVGTAANLYRYSGLAWASVIGSLTATSWDFCQFGDLIIGANGAAPVKFDIEGGTGGTLLGSPPESKHCATVAEGYVFLAGEPHNEHTVFWSAFNNAEGWAAGTGGSGFKELYTGGRVTGLAGGEYAIVLQENQIVRASEAGEGSFAFDPISENVGCIASGSIGQEGRMVFFYSQRGFMMTEGNTVIPIGNEKVNRTFRKRYAREDIISTLSCSVDPSNSRVFWAMPDRIWCFNWELGRWSYITVQNSGVFAGFSSNISLEALDALYPGGIDSIPYSLDDPRFSGGVPKMYLVRPDSKLYTLSGSNMKACFELAEMDNNTAFRYRRARPNSDSLNYKLTMKGGQRRGELTNSKTFTNLRPSGDMDIRFRARHIKPTLEIPEGEAWTFCNDIEFEFEGSGRR